MTSLTLTRLILITALAANTSINTAAWAAAPNVLRDVGIDQRLDAQLPLNLSFQDENGDTVRFGDYFDSRPVVLVLAYYRCPMLCTQVLNGLVTSMREMDLEL